MNTAIDINSLAVRYPQFDPDAPDPQLEQEAREASADDYVDDWLRGNLADMDDVFSGPLQALIDNEPELLTELLADHRRGSVDEFEQTSGRLARAIERYVRAQAEM